MQRYRILGTNQDQDSCECCGKTGLKKVVWLSELDADGNTTGKPLAVGCNCAAKLARIPTGRVERLATDADETARKAELAKVHEVGFDRSVCTWIIEAVGNNGGTMTALGFANGLKSVVEPWANVRWPNRELLVRKAI